MFGALFELARPLLHALDPEQAHELTSKALEAGFYPRAPRAPMTPAVRARALGNAFPNPAWHRRRLRQGRPCRRRRRSPGLRFCRGRHRDPASAGRQSAAARLFRLPLTGIINRLGFNNRLARRGLSASCAGRRRLRHRRRQHRCQPRCGDRAADYVDGFAASATSPATSPSTFLTQYARLARSAGAGAARALLQRVLARARRSSQPASRVDRSWSKWRPTSPRPTCQASLRWSWRGASMASPSATPRLRARADRCAAWRRSGRAVRPTAVPRSTVVLARTYQLARGPCP